MISFYSFKHTIEWHIFCACFFTILLIVVSFLFLIADSKMFLMEDHQNGDVDLNIDEDEYDELDEYSYHLSIPMLSTSNAILDEDGRFICDCGKTYKEERYLRYHRKWECGKLPTFQCPHCDYSAKRRNSLKQHLERRHSYVPQNFKT